MNYLPDRRAKKKNLLYILPVVVFLFTLVYFRAPLANFVSVIFKPILQLGNKVANFGSSEEVARLEEELRRRKAEMQNYQVLQDENIRLQEILGRKGVNQNFVLAGILAKPNVSPYDTLLIDLGESDGVGEGSRVFAYGNIPIGRVNEVTSTTAKVLLFSSPGVTTEAVISGGNVFAELLGRGGGNFEMTLPRDLAVDSETPVVLPGIPSYVVAIVEATISDPRDAFTKILLVSPVNIFELKFVQVER